MGKESKKGHKRTPSGVANLSYLCIALGSVLLCLYLYYQYDGQGLLQRIGQIGIVNGGSVSGTKDVESPATTAEKGEVKTHKKSEDKVKKKAIPNYFEYQAMARREGWSPEDPLHKLRDVVTQFGSSSVGTRWAYEQARQGQDGGDASDPTYTIADQERDRVLLSRNMSLLIMRQQELAFVLEVLKQPLESAQDGTGSTAAAEVQSAGDTLAAIGSGGGSGTAGSSLDVSGLFFFTADTLQRCVYSHIKYSLGSEAAENGQVVVTKTGIEASADESVSFTSDPAPSLGVCYHPLQQLLKLRGDVVVEREQHDLDLLLGQKKRLRDLLQRSREAGKEVIERGSDLESRILQELERPRPLSKAADKRKLQHLNIELGARPETHAAAGERHDSLLGIVVRNRLYRVLPTVLQFAADVDDVVINGLHYAVVNGDDFALGVLIRGLYQQVGHAHQQESRKMALRVEMRAMASKALGREVGAVPGKPRIEQRLVDLYRKHASVLQRYVAYLGADREQQEALGMNSEVMRSRLVQELLAPLKTLADSTASAPSADQHAVSLKDVIPAGMSMQFKAHNSYYRTTTASSSRGEVESSASDVQAADGSVAGGVGSGGYIDLGIAATPASGMSEHCAIDRLDMADAGSLATFHNRYAALNQPVLLFNSKGNGGALGVDAVEQRWSFDALMSSNSVHGGDSGGGSDAEKELSFTSSTIPYASLFGGKRSEQHMSLQAFLADMRLHATWLRNLLSSMRKQKSSAGSSEHEDRAVELVDLVRALRDADEDPESPAYLLPRYIFDNKVVAASIMRRLHGEHQPANTTAMLLSVLPRSLYDLVYFIDSVRDTGSQQQQQHLLYQWYLGSTLTGAPFHSHAPAFNVLVHGRKLWQLLPPGRDIYSKVHPLEWLKGVLGGSEQSIKQLYPHHKGESGGEAKDGAEWPCMVEQRAGEVLFVPRHVSHQVINLAEVVGFAVEVSDYHH